MGFRGSRVQIPPSRLHNDKPHTSFGAGLLSPAPTGQEPAGLIPGLTEMPRHRLRRHASRRREHSHGKNSVSTLSRHRVTSKPVEFVIITVAMPCSG